MPLSYFLEICRVGTATSESQQEVCIRMTLHRVLQVKFSADGNFLYTGARKDPDILCWDVRYTSDVVYRLQRQTADTNQRIQFDIEPMGRHLTTGIVAA